MPRLAVIPELTQYAALALLAVSVVLLAWIASMLVRLLTEGSPSKQADSSEEALRAIQEHLVAMRSAQNQGLDLHRIEHLLVDIRDHGERLQGRLVTLAESGARPATPDMGWPLADRATARLLASGYDRIEWILPEGGWPGLESQDGEVRVEARKAGSLYKGRMLIQSGQIGEVHLRPAHSVFP